MGVFRGRSLLAYGALLPLMAIIACTQAVTTPAPEFLKAAEERAPFDIVLPTFLPHGMELVNADVIVPPPGMAITGDEEDARRELTQVILRFANADVSATFVLYESFSGASLGAGNVSRVDIGGAEGELGEDEERRFISMTWRGKDIGFLLTAYMTGTLTRDEVMRIAESIGG